MKSKRLVLHLFSGPDEKTWRALGDADAIGGVRGQGFASTK